MTEQVSSDQGGRPRPPGYLLTPFGWAAPGLATMVAAEPRLLAHLFELDRWRMHVIALALAHIDGNVSPQVGLLLVRASAKEILDHVLGRRPMGIKRVLRRLPYAVLPAESYRQLVDLLNEPETAKLLHHLPETTITDSTIRLLHEVPVPLRSVVLALVEFIHRLDHLADGLRLLAARGAAPSFNALVADLAARSQPAQFVARMKQLVAALPLPETLPPAQIGKARRLDRTEDVRVLAKRWKNCLVMYTHRIDAGECAIYLWDDANAPAICQVTRHGRLGWFLSDARGPQNVDLEPDQMALIEAAFAEVGIPQDSIIFPIECILEWDGNMRLRRSRQQRQLESREREQVLQEEAWEG